MGNISIKHSQGSCHFFIPLIPLSHILLWQISLAWGTGRRTSAKFYFGLPFSIVHFGSLDQVSVPAWNWKVKCLVLISVVFYPQHRASFISLFVTFV
jgi:hypothetical protein